MIFFVFRSMLMRYCFIIFYTSNPLVIYFALFPLYYFWMFLPSMLFSILILKKKWKSFLLFFSVPVFLFSILIRPTTLFLTGLFFVVAFRSAYSRIERRKIIAISVVYAASVWFVLKLSPGSPWHTMYIGIGAYANDLGIPDTFDQRGTDYFYKKTGIAIDTNPVYGNWNESKIRNIYLKFLKNIYYNIMKERPFLLIRNAFLNILQVFSVGYIVGCPIWTWASTALGFFVLVFLIYTRQFIWIQAILASASSFAWYYPPIPSYNFSAYLLLAIGGISGLEQLFQKKVTHFQEHP